LIDTANLQESPIAFISHERKQVAITFCHDACNI